MKRAGQIDLTSNFSQSLPHQDGLFTSVSHPNLFAIVVIVKMCLLPCGGEKDAIIRGAFIRVLICST